MGNIFPRFPDIKTAMGVQEGAFGLSLIGTPTGTLISLTVAAPILERIGFRRALLALIPLVALTFAIASHAPSPLTFFLLLVPVGIMLGCVEIILNVEADRTEFLIGRRIMNRAHSFWSIGFFTAGIFGGLIAQAGVSPQLHLALVVPIAHHRRRAVPSRLPALAEARDGHGWRSAPLRAPDDRHPDPRRHHAVRPSGRGRQPRLVGDLHARHLRDGSR